MTATNDGNGNWSATITPIGIGGGAVVVNAVHGGNPTLQQIVEAPQGVFVSKYHMRYQMDTDWEVPLFESNVWRTLDWEDGKGGTGNNGSDGTMLNINTWPASSWPTPLPDGMNQEWLFNGYWSTNLIGGPDLKNEHCDTFDWTTKKSGNWSFWTTERRPADTEMKLATGGPMGSRQMNLWCISATATDQDTGLPISPAQIQIGAFGNLDSDGNLYVMLPDGTNLDATPIIAGAPDYYTFNVTALKHTLVSYTWHPALTNPDRARTMVGVGEEVSVGANRSDR